MLIEERRVEGLLMVKDAPDGVEEFAHDGDDRLLGFLAPVEESLIAGFNLLVALDRDQGGHEEGGAQMDVASLTDAARLMHGGAAIKRPRIESGVSHPLRSFEPFGQDEQFTEEAQATLIRNAGRGGQHFQRLGEQCTAAGELEGFLFQRDDAALQVRKVEPQIAGNDLACGRELRDGMQAILFACDLAFELGEPSRELLEGQHIRRRWGPGNEGHPAQVIEDPEGIDPIGLGPLHAGADEVFDGSGIEHHDLHARLRLQVQGEGHAVNPSRFQGDPNATRFGGQLLEQLAMARRGVGIGLEARWTVPISADGNDQFAGADVGGGPEEGRLDLLHRWFGFRTRVRFPDLVQ